MGCDVYDMFTLFWFCFGPKLFFLGHICSWLSYYFHLFSKCLSFFLSIPILRSKNYYFVYFLSGHDFLGLFLYCTYVYVLSYVPNIAMYFSTLQRKGVEIPQVATSSHPYSLSYITMSSELDCNLCPLNW